MDLARMVDRVRGMLDQYVTDRPIMCTFTDETDDGFILTPITGYGSLGGSFLAEVGWELIQVESYNPETNLAQVPPWGRAQLGTETYPVQIADRVIVNPTWPYWHVAEALIDGMHQLYPDVFGVGDVELTTSVLQERYELPDDCDGILDIRVQWFDAPETETRIERFSVDVSNADGKRYLHIPPPSVSSRPIRITYRRQPTIPVDPTDADWTWEDSGFPRSARDLPILHAAMTMILSPEAARLQNFSSEQSDRNRNIQAGAANAVSRRLEERYNRRLEQERRKLLELYPLRVRRQYNG